MKLATLADGTRDGALAVVSREGERFLSASTIAHTLQAALERWNEVEAPLRALARQLDAGEIASRPIAEAQILAPLPRAWQWLDGSAFASHGALMDKVLGVNPEKTGRPLMYQGVSDRFYAATEDVPMVDEELGVDFEGEFGVIVDETPMGVSPEEALGHIRLLVQINDWSLRKLAGPEMKSGFGWVQAKPPCSMAPFAVTPDEAGGAWRDGRICLNLTVDWNGERFGDANGAPMGHGFHELVAHAARTRTLCAGTVIGSGTVSNEIYREVGSSCIAERRGIEIVDFGEPRTGFMKFGDRVRMEARGPGGGLLFGAIDQRVTPAGAQA